MIIAFDIPDNAVELRSWLDQQLVGLRLSQLVEELRTIGSVMYEKAESQSEPASASESLSDILNRDIRMQVLQQGTSALKDSQIQALFWSPDALLDLQEDIFINGGKFWQTVPRTAEHNRLAAFDFDKLREKIRAAESAQPMLELVSAKEPSSQVLVQRGTWRTTVLAAAVLAMSILVTLAVLKPSREPQISGTGFGKPGLLDNNANSQLEYFQRMSAANDEWLQTTRSDTAALLAALKAYSSDCQNLIDSKHPALDDRNERWLKSKCGEWKGRIDEVIVALESDKMSFEDATWTVNDVVGKLVKKLNSGPTEDDLKKVG